MVISNIGQCKYGNIRYRTGSMVISKIGKWQISNLRNKTMAIMITGRYLAI